MITSDGWNVDFSSLPTTNRSQCACCKRRDATKPENDRKVLVLCSDIKTHARWVTAMDASDATDGPWDDDERYDAWRELPARPDEAELQGLLDAKRKRKMAPFAERAR